MVVAEKEMPYERATIQKTPAKFKQTEVGEIPEDWKITPIEELFTFQGGSQPPRSTFIFQEREGYVRLLQIRDYKTDKYASYIPEYLVRRNCSVDDIMIGRYGPPIFQILNGLEGAYNVALIKAIPTVKITKQYGWFLLNQQKLFDFIDKLSQRSSGQTGVDLVELKKYQIPLPPTKAEQTAIATALSDADALISRLETLIAKKRAIKQGAMQQLLKPKEGWVVKKLGDAIDKIVGGGTPSRSRPDYWNGSIPWVTVKDFATFNPSFSQEYITKDGLMNSASNLIPRGTLITSTRMALGKAIVYNVDVSINQDLKALFPKRGIDTTFLYYWFQYNSEFIESLGSGSTVMGISLVDLKKIEFHQPTIGEQTRIAQILSDMDAEIAGLEQKLSKYKRLKQGMMQELLTGKTRLV